MKQIFLKKMKKIKKRRPKMNKEMDLKYSIGVHVKGDPSLFKTSNKQKIPADEPTILFRGRDKLALPMLKYYLNLCEKDNCTDYQLKQMHEMITRFEKFSQESSTMKQPGSTL